MAEKFKDETIDNDFLFNMSDSEFDRLEAEYLLTLEKEK